jgi:Fe-S-cluster containining protein
MVDDVKGSPATWTASDFELRWQEHLESLAATGGTGLSPARVRFQAEQSPVFRETADNWDGLAAEQRVAAWKRLLEDCAQNTAEPLAVCVRCGDCCRRGSPTLELDDLELLREEQLPWSELTALRAGEPARSPLTGEPFYLEGERIKLRERPGTAECVFLDAETAECRIHPDRPLQCRAQACWEEPDPQRLVDAEYLTRRHILAGAEPLLELLDEHDRRCSFARLREVFEQLKLSGGTAVDPVLEVLAFDEHVREFAAEKLSLPSDTLDLVFGRSLASRLKLFGFRVELGADGTRTLLPE